MTPFAKRKYKKYLGFCAAACLVFVCGAVFLFGHIGRTEIFINGKPVSDQPIAVGMSTPSPYDIRQIKTNLLVVPFEIVTRDKIILETTDGTMEVYSSKTKELTKSGQFCETKGSITVQWSIEDPDRSQIYELQISSMATSLLLKFEPKTNNWIIQKSED